MESADHLARDPVEVRFGTQLGSGAEPGESSPAVEDLKTQGDGTIAVLGSGALVQDLIADDLVDGYRLFLHPLLLGSGKKLYRQMGRPRRLRLVGCTPTTTEVVMLSYEQA